MQTGVVVQVDPKKDLAIVLIDGKDHALFEIKVGSDLVIGSCLRGPLYVLGRNLFITVSGNKEVPAFGLTGSCSLAHCRSKLKGDVQ